MICVLFVNADSSMFELAKNAFVGGGVGHGTVLNVPSCECVSVFISECTSHHFLLWHCFPTIFLIVMRLL